MSRPGHEISGPVKNMIHLCLGSEELLLPSAVVEEGEAGARQQQAGEAEGLLLTVREHVGPVALDVQPPFPLEQALQTHLAQDLPQPVVGDLPAQTVLEQVAQASGDSV